MIHSTHRVIRIVIDTTLPAGQQQRAAQAILDPLSVVELAELRTGVNIAFRAGQPRFLCAACRAPLYVAQNPAGPQVAADGRGAHFRHYATPDAPPCEQRSAANIRDIGAVKFAGLAEGRNHADLKRQLALCLSQDPEITDIRVERQIRAEDGSWRQPDVSARIGSRLVAFDLQLAGASLQTILERAAFYAANDICHVWLTDAADLTRLSQLAFRDLHLNSGGRIFAIDTEVVAACVESARFQLKELSIVPRLAPPLPIHNVWDVAMVDKPAIMIAPQRRKIAGEMTYQKALLAQVTARFGPGRTLIRKAAAGRQDLNRVASQWNAIARQTGGRNAETARHDNLGAVLAWLQAVEAFVKTAPADQAPAMAALQAATGRLLCVRHARDWAPLVDTTCTLFGSVRTALSPDNRAQLVNLLTTTGTVAPRVRTHASMLAMLYPWLGFRLIVKAPKYAPN